jgi:hypothetical protein
MTGRLAVKMELGSEEESTLLAVPAAKALSGSGGLCFLAGDPEERRPEAYLSLLIEVAIEPRSPRFSLLPCTLCLSCCPSLPVEFLSGRCYFCLLALQN